MVVEPQVDATFNIQTQVEDQTRSTCKVLIICTPRERQRERKVP